MTVRGKIVSSSHVGGLLVEFDSRPPGLGWDVRIEGGKSIGRNWWKRAGKRSSRKAPRRYKR